MSTRAYAAVSSTSPLAPFSISRRDPLPTDVEIEILYCGVCHSDLHWARNEWGMTVHPCVPGHEIVGRVTRIGKSVRRFKEGDRAAVGCLVDSCRTCASCTRGLEQFCLHGAVFTYGGADKHSGGQTYGGYSEKIVVDEAFVLRLGDTVDLPGTAPLLCAGITTWSPIRHWRVGKGMKTGIIGLGGLGHMGVKFASTFGAHVVLFTTSPGKAADAKRLGAHEVVLSTDPDAMAKHAGSFDFILDTVSAPHDINACLALLKLDGTLCMVGVPEKPLALSAFSVIMPRRNLAGSLIGGLSETQQMLDYCAERGIVSDIEIIPMQAINTAYERLLRSDVRYRFVIDMASIRRSG